MAKFVVECRLWDVWGGIKKGMTPNCIDQRVRVDVAKSKFTCEYFALAAGKGLTTRKNVTNSCPRTMEIRAAGPIEEMIWKKGEDRGDGIAFKKSKKADGAARRVVTRAAVEEY